MRPNNSQQLNHIGISFPEILHFLMSHKSETWDTLKEVVNRGSREVAVVEMMKRPGQDIGGSTRWTVMAELRRLGGRIQGIPKWQGFRLKV